MKTYSYTYWLRCAPSVPWVEVSQEEFVEAEHSAGLYPKAGCGPVATRGFMRGSFEGRVVLKPTDVEQDT